MNFRVEYDSRPILHIAAQCPGCGRWFHGSDMTDHYLGEESSIYYANFTCPICGYETTSHEEINIKECRNAFEVYDKCYRKKTIWEIEQDNE